MGKKRGKKSSGENAAQLAAKMAAEDDALNAALEEAVAETLAINSVVRVDESIDSTKPQTDKKTYRLIELVNGIECLLVHDSDDEEFDDDDDEDEEGDNGDEENDTGYMDEDGSDDDDDDDEGGGGGGGGDDGRVGRKRAAAAMAVGIGSWADPPHLQGCAHFLEHMLFMGSEKYPKENHYDSIVSKYGGTTNAFTECEHTVYHFEVYPKKFNEVLDIFSQFFIGKPLFRKDAIDREINSIESEFIQTQNNDESRMDELLCRSAPIGHPYGNFTWGNKQSLIDEPIAAGVDVYGELRKFYNEYYQTSRMKLVVTSANSLDEMEQLVARTFSVRKETNQTMTTVPNNLKTDQQKTSKKSKSKSKSNKPSSSLSIVKQEGPLEVPPLNHTAALKKLVLVAAVSEVHELRLTWVLPEQLSKWRSKSADLVAHLVGHESTGSALSLLRKLGYAIELSAGIGDSGLDSSTCCSLFRINITLTNIGLIKWLKVIKIIFQYISLIHSKGNELKWVFDEVSSITKMGYEYREEDEAADLVEDLAVLMLPSYQYHGDILRGSELLFDWEPQEMKGILNTLKPENCRLEILSSNFTTPTTNQQDKEEDKEEGNIDNNNNNNSSSSKPPLFKKRDFNKIDENDNKDSKQNMNDDEHVEKMKKMSTNEQQQHNNNNNNNKSTNQMSMPFAGIGCNCRNRRASKHNNLSPDQSFCRNALCFASLAESMTDMAPSSSSVSKTTMVDDVKSESSMLIDDNASDQSFDNELIAKERLVYSRSELLVQKPPSLHQRSPCIEPRFGTKYWEFDLDEEFIALWKQCEVPPTDPSLTYLALPQPNPFIATNFDIKYNEEEKIIALSNASQTENEFLKEIRVDFDTLIKNWNGTHLDTTSSGVNDAITGGSGGGGKKRKGKNKTKNAMTTPPRSNDERPVASLPGPPFTKPGQTPTPVVPTRTMLFLNDNDDQNDDQNKNDDQACIIELWHLPSYSFSLPRLEVYLRFTTKACNHNGIEQCVASELYTMLFTDYIAERSYLASMAGIDFSCKNNESGIVFHYTGFSDMLSIFIKETWSIFLNLSSLISTSSSSSSSSSSTPTTSSSTTLSSSTVSSYNHMKRFQSCKERLEKIYMNYFLKPSKHANRLRLCILKLKHSYHPHLKRQTLMGQLKHNLTAKEGEGGEEAGAEEEVGEEKAAVMLPKNKDVGDNIDNGITFEDMTSTYMPQILSQGRIQMFVCGNANHNEAYELAKDIKKELINSSSKTIPISQSQFPEHRILHLHSIASNQNQPNQNQNNQNQNNDKVDNNEKMIEQTNEGLNTTTTTTTSVLSNTDSISNDPIRRKQRVYVTVCSEDVTQNNSACELYWQIGPDCLTHRVLIDVLEQLMSESLFDYLRTKEQLGYSGMCVFCLLIH